MDVKATICFYSLASIIAFTTMLEDHDQKRPRGGAKKKKKKSLREVKLGLTLRLHTKMRLYQFSIPDENMCHLHPTRNDSRNLQHCFDSGRYQTSSQNH